MLPVPSNTEAAASLERARNKAAVHLELLAEKLTEKSLDPAATVKTMLDAAEFNYKLSGLAGKQAPAPTGGGMKVTFNFNAARPSGRTFDMTVEAEPDVLGNPPPLVSLIPVTNDLACDLEPE